MTRFADAYRNLMTRHAEGADADAAFDGGEWSGPAHARMLERELDALAASYGYADLETALADLPADVIAELCPDDLLPADADFPRGF